MQLAELQTILDEYGLLAQGHLVTGEGTLVLVGNAGSDLWAIFVQSDEFEDGQPDPLDRWCRRIGEDLAEHLSGEVIFPFAGPPYPPILRWAEQAGISFPSPVSMAIHTRYGLWHAFRFVLVLDHFEAEHPVEHTESPCVSCLDQPCLETCPVNAFDVGVYRVDACLGYLDSEVRTNDLSGCRSTGCAARRACPMGNGYAYEPEHARFHMEAFIAAHGSPSTTKAG